MKGEPPSLPQPRPGSTPKPPPHGGQGPSHALCGLLAKGKGAREAAEPCPAREAEAHGTQGGREHPLTQRGASNPVSWGSVPQEPRRSTINQVGDGPDESLSDDRKTQVCLDTGSEYLIYFSTRHAPPPLPPESSGPFTWHVGPRSLTGEGGRKTFPCKEMGYSEASVQMGPLHRGGEPLLCNFE